MSNYPDDFDAAAHDARYGVRPFFCGEADFLVDMIRDGAFDNEPHLAPKHTPASVAHNACPDCLSVAGKLCRDWTRSPVTDEWRGSGYVIEGVHSGRFGAMVSA